MHKGTIPARRLQKAQILLKADESEGGEGWSDIRIMEALRVCPESYYLDTRNVILRNTLVVTRISVVLVKVARYHYERNRAVRIS